MAAAGIEEKDVIVLGSGPGGYVAAIRAAQLGRKVSIVERENLGGVCLNWGCIPTKALLKAAQLYHDIGHSSEYGFEVTGVKLDFPQVIGRSRSVAEKISGGVNFLMRKNKIEVIRGNGVLEANKRLTVSDAAGASTSYSFSDIIIATGGRARHLPHLEVDGDVVHDYRTLLAHKKLPQRLLVIGAGAIGVEFAYFYNAFGAQVTIVEMMDGVVPLEDGEISKGLRRSFEKQGMSIKTGTAVSDVRCSGKTITATLKTSNGEEEWSGDCCLVAIGVVANVEHIGLESVGIELDRGFIKVDSRMRTNVPHHFAIGDVTGPPLLAHVASHEALIAAEVMCGMQDHEMYYDNIPACTYCQPQVASVGWTEEKCKEEGVAYRVGKVPFSAIGKAVATGEPEGMIKVIVDEEVGEVLGVHILHAEATELIAEAAVIRSHEGIAASVVDTIHPHPTLSESMMEAMAAAIGRPINT